MRRYIPLVFLISAILISGCINQNYKLTNKNPDEAVKIVQQTKEVQEFLKKYPDANPKVIIGDEFDKIAFVEYIVRTEIERLNFFIYIDKTTGEIERMEIAVLNETGLEYSTENISGFLSNR